MEHLIVKKKKEFFSQQSVKSNIEEEKNTQIKIENTQSIWTKTEKDKYNFIWNIKDHSKFFLLKNLYINVFLSNVLICRNIIIPIQNHIQKILFKYLWSWININQSITLSIVISLPMFYLTYKITTWLFKKLNSSWYEDIITELSNNGKTCNIHIELNQENKNEWKRFIENITQIINEIKQKNWKYKKVEEICLSSHLFWKVWNNNEQQLTQIGKKIIDELNISDENITEKWKIWLLRMLWMYRKKLFSKEHIKRLLEIRKKFRIYDFKIQV